MIKRLYHYEIIELKKEGYKVFILHDNGFTGTCIVYRLKATYKYLYKQYYSKRENYYNVYY
jgi:hypothetical protein